MGQGAAVAVLLSAHRIGWVWLRFSRQSDPDLDRARDRDRHAVGLQFRGSRPVTFDAIGHHPVGGCHAVAAPQFPAVSTPQFELAWNPFSISRHSARGLSCISAEPVSDRDHALCDGTLRPSAAEGLSAWQQLVRPHALFVSRPGWPFLPAVSGVAGRDGGVRDPGRRRSRRIWRLVPIRAPNAKKTAHPWTCTLYSGRLSSCGAP